MPALVAQMERLQQVAARRADVIDGQVDVKSPYFGRIVLQEGDRKREVLIGRATYLDPETGVQIVDWRDAPVSRVYYRYDEGDDYDEQFGGRWSRARCSTRRSLGDRGWPVAPDRPHAGHVLAPAQRSAGCAWATASSCRAGRAARRVRRTTSRSASSASGQRGTIREDKHLPEIAALIDARQFDLITEPRLGAGGDSGRRGQRQDDDRPAPARVPRIPRPQRFRPDRMLVVVFNDALARYIRHVLPALGVPGVPVTTFYAWARKLRRQHCAAAARPAIRTRRRTRWCG